MLHGEAVSTLDTHNHLPDMMATLSSAFAMGLVHVPVRTVSKAAAVQDTGAPPCQPQSAPTRAPK